MTQKLLSRFRRFLLLLTMSKIFAASLFVILFGSPITSVAAQQPSLTDPVDLVNPLIGTSGDGQIIPSIGLPFGMTQWTPQTHAGEAKCIAPYYASDTRIQGFRGTHWMSGSCTQDYGSVTLMPLVDVSRLDPAGRSLAFSHSGEVARPYEYSVDLGDSLIHADITGTERSGIMRFRFATGQHKGYVAVENNRRKGDGWVRIDTQKQEITGENPVFRIYAGNGLPAGFSGYFVVQFSRRFKPGGTWIGDSKPTGSLSARSSLDTSGAYVSFDLQQDATVMARIGTSFVSVDEARKNLQQEVPAWGFDQVVSHVRDSWKNALAVVNITGESPGRIVFYTALYHAMQLPRTFSDRSGAYPRFAGGQSIEHAVGFTYYDDFSIWDTFRAVHPLLTLLQPDRECDMVKSLITKGQQGGYLPIFPAWNSYTSEMVGDHADAVIVDAYVKGIRCFDPEAAYDLMRKNATQSPSNEQYRNGLGRRALKSYLQYGYIPLEDHVSDAFHADEQVSRTLEYAYDDFLVGTMASALGHVDDAKVFAVRAQNYRKVIDPETGFARGRNVNGTWSSPFDPAGKYTYITEGLPYQYTFFVPQDVPGLIELEHGPQAFVKKLDGLFAGNYYDQGNEPSHHIAYLYDYAGEPEKTQLHIHQVMQQYRDAPNGLPGNDDTGQMSAWYVLSALGFYSVTPGTPDYAIGTPYFDDATLYLPAGKVLHIHAQGAESGKFYVRSIHLNGRLLEKPFISHGDLVAGGELVFDMAAQPSRHD